MLHWKQYATMPEEELATCDVAEMNLSCAADLPGSENYDFDLCLQSLDLSARFVRQYTQRMLPQFYRKPHEYHNSDNYYRILCMVTLMQRDLGLRYNPAKIPLEIPLAPPDAFIHGAILGEGGTCASIPVVYAAVGRRLGYPLKLVTARGKECEHLFARWDDPKGERFNIEAVNGGLACQPDVHYRTDPYETTPYVEKAGCYMRSMTPRQELATFIAQRSFCWLDLNNHRRAIESLAWACALVPGNRIWLDGLKEKMNEWLRQLDPLKPPNFPEISVGIRERRFPATLPLELEVDILGLEATDNILRDPEHDQNWWQAMRHGLRPIPTPVQVTTRFAGDACSVSFKCVS